MTQINVKISPNVFNAVYRPWLDDTARVQIRFGGSSSGKSVFLAQRVVILLLRGGHNFLICRQVARTVRRSVMQEVIKVINTWGMGTEFKIQYQDGVITCRNGFQAVFIGLDDVEKVKSITAAKGVFTDIWVEEATETDRKTIKQLMKRQRGGSEKTRKTITLSFNPILQSHWIYEEYFAPIGWADDQVQYSSPDLSIFKTTYKDNQFLTTEDVKDLENETDKYFYDVYTLGKWGVLGNVIFTNWTVRDLTAKIPHFDNLRDGVDFGFADDPAAWPGTHYDKKYKTLYIFDEIYERDLTNDVLAELLRSKVGNRRVKCDSAEPKSIAELRKYKINAVGAKKGPDSVMFGIQWLRQQKIVIDTNCVNTRKEFQLAKWKEDSSGKPVSPPRMVERDDHIIAALRYACEDDMLETRAQSAKVNLYSKPHEKYTPLPARDESEVADMLKESNYV